MKTYEEHLDYLREFKLEGSCSECGEPCDEDGPPFCQKCGGENKLRARKEREYGDDDVDFKVRENRP